MIDINFHYTHSDSSASSLTDLLRARNDNAVREQFVARIALEVSPIALDSLTTINRMRG